MQDETNFWSGLIKPWIELNNLCWHLTYEQTFGKFAQTPPVGINRGFNLKLMQAFDAWARIYPPAVAYQMVLTEIQLQSLQILIQELILQAEKGETMNGWSQILQLWSYTADRVFETAFCGEDNLKIRGSLLNAINYYKLCQQELLETWLTTMNLPTRSELDEIHKTIYELRKEMKYLKKALADNEMTS